MAGATSSPPSAFVALNLQKNDLSKICAILFTRLTLSGAVWAEEWSVRWQHIVWGVVVLCGCSQPLDGSQRNEYPFASGLPRPISPNTCGDCNGLGGGAVLFFLNSSTICLPVTSRNAIKGILHGAVISDEVTT